MNTLIKAAEILDPSSPHHKRTCDILIKDGIIKQIADSITDNSAETLHVDGQKVSPGWMDLRVNLTDPGFEAKETLHHTLKAAAAGGFTRIATLPNTNPVVQTKDMVAYLKDTSRLSPVSVHPLAAVTESTEGKSITEMMDLHHAGAKGFTDGIYPIWHSGALLNALRYLKGFNGLLLTSPEDLQLTANGTMNEGKTSTYLGLKGIPAFAEELIIHRDLRFLDYTEGKIHFSRISTKNALDVIRDARKKGYQITCDATTHHLGLTEDMLMSFDSNYKVRPPLRTQSDVKALWEGVKDGTIDAIVSDHAPHEDEAKNIEFELAEFGITGLETAFSLLNKFNPGVPLETLLQKLTSGPGNILQVEQNGIEEGVTADITLFHPGLTWTYSNSRIQSKARNNPYIGQQLQGRVIGVWNNQQSFVNPEFRNS